MRPGLFDAVGGLPALTALAEAWHRRCLADPVVSHAFSHPGQHPDHTRRLAAYWAEALGGPTTYTATMADHSHVLRLHAGNGEHREMDERAQDCFASALTDAAVPDDLGQHETLKRWFRWATEDLARHPRSAEDVPADEPLPVWGWDGLVPPPRGPHP